MVEAWLVDLSDVSPDPLSKATLSQLTPAEILTTVAAAAVAAATAAVPPFPGASLTLALSQSLG